MSETSPNTFTQKREIQEKYRFWTDKKVSQLSFHNNILLSIGLAVCGYFWAELNNIFSTLVVDLGANIDWSAIVFIAAFIAIAASITSGFILSLSRLYDLRLTSKIILIRVRSLDKEISITDEELSLPSFGKSMKTLFSVFLNYPDYDITKEEIKSGMALQEKFTVLRQHSRDLGFSTWSLVKCQTLSMLIGILLLLLTIVVR